MNLAASRQAWARLIPQDNTLSQKERSRIRGDARRAKTARLREQVLAMRAHGLTTKVICERAGCGESTVRHIVRSAAE